jgi:hypothetical protein
MGEGEFALVRETLEGAFKTTNPAVGDHDLYATLADAAALQRDESGLRQYAPLAEHSAAQVGHVLYQGIAHRAWGVLHALSTDYAASNMRLKQALALFEQLDTRWQLGRTLFELGDIARAQALDSAARDYYKRSLALFESMKAAPAATQVRAALEMQDHVR